MLWTEFFVQIFLCPYIHLKKLNWKSPLDEKFAI